MFSRQVLHCFEGYGSNDSWLFIAIMVSLWSVWYMWCHLSPSSPPPSPCWCCLIEQQKVCPQTRYRVSLWWQEESQTCRTKRCPWVGTCYGKIPPPPPPLGNGGVFPSWVVTVVRCPYWCTVADLVSLGGGVESYFSRVRVFPHQAAYCGQVLLPGSACPPQYFSTEERNLTCRKRELPLVAYC